MASPTFSVISRFFRIVLVLTVVQIVQYVELEEKKLVINDEQEADPTELREKQPNHARVILYQAMRRWGNLRADNLSAVVVTSDYLFLQ